MIYMDCNATTPLDPRVLETMVPFLKENFGNPSSLYGIAREARTAVETARKQVSSLLGCREDEIYFTSGGSESDNWAIQATAFSRSDKGKHIVTSAIEHHAVLNACRFLEKRGFRVTYLPVNAGGLVDPEDLRKAVTKETILVTIMYANNEIGTIQPAAELARISREGGVLFHTDAVQAVGKIPFAVPDIGADMLSLSAHKIYGPKGVGALYVRKGTRLAPLIYGGGQERGKRAGTENVAGIVGLGKAAEIALAERETEEARVRELRDRLEAGIRDRIPEVIFNGDPGKRLSNTTNFCVRHIEGEGILLNLDFEGICASSGSACTSGSLEPSHVLLALGIPHEVAHGSIRLSLGKYTTGQDVEKLLEVLPGIVAKLRAMSPFWNRDRRDGKP